MPFPLLTVGASKSATGVKVFVPLQNKLIVSEGPFSWNPTEVNRWSVSTPGVVLWRQMYATERETSGSPQWGQHWPRK